MGRNMQQQINSKIHNLQNCAFVDAAFLVACFYHNCFRSFCV
jgi:hypothetical protein